jgi:AraC-like DNA-binding protein
VVPAHEHASTWTGILVLGVHFALLRGHAGVTTAHAHYAHQLLLATEGDWVVEVGADTWRGRSLLLPSFQSHAVLVAPADACTVFLEPSHVDLQALQARLPDLPSVPDALLPHLQTLTAAPLDRRLQAALARLEARLPERIAASDIADAAHLSESQLHRRFQQDLAVSLRGLVLWRRLREALIQVIDGQTLTASAHAAGFADLAHFSRNLRRMFGVRAEHLSGLRLQRYGEG